MGNITKSLWANITNAPNGVLSGTQRIPVATQPGANLVTQIQYLTVAQILAGAAPPVGTLLTATKALTNAQVLALPTTSQEIIAAPAAGELIFPILALLHLDWTADYTNIAASCAIDMEWGASAASPLSVFDNQGNSSLDVLLGDGGDTLGFLIPASFNQGNAENGVVIDASQVAAAVGANLGLFAFNAAAGDFTGGDAANVLNVTVFYFLLTGF